jgi:hypothetical protein
MPHLVGQTLIVAIAAPNLMPPSATLPSSMAIDKRIQSHLLNDIPGVVVAGGHHDWQVPIAAAASKRQVGPSSSKCQLCGCMSPH